MKIPSHKHEIKRMPIFVEKTFSRSKWSHDEFVCLHSDMLIATVVRSSKVYLKINCGREQTHFNHCWRFYRYSFGLIFLFFVVVVVFHFVLVCHCATWMVEAPTHVFVWWNGCVVLLFLSMFALHFTNHFKHTESVLQTDAQNRIRQHREKKHTPNWTTGEETSKTIQCVYPWDSSKWNYTEKKKKQALELSGCICVAELPSSRFVRLLCANRRDTW